MDYNTVSAVEFGKSFTGLGVNIIVKSPARTAQFLEAVFELYPSQLSADFALIRYQDYIFQLHSDKSFAAQACGSMVLQPATDKPHGLREATILCPDGYMWVPSRPLA
jgi:hypothetical protein